MKISQIMIHHITVLPKILPVKSPFFAKNSFRQIALYTEFTICQIN